MSLSAHPINEWPTFHSGVINLTLANLHFFRTKSGRWWLVCVVLGLGFEIESRPDEPPGVPVESLGREFA